VPDKTLLVVDDEPENLELTRRVVEDADQRAMFADEARAR
jgi:hypothetical protein